MPPATSNSPLRRYGAPVALAVLIPAALYLWRAPQRRSAEIADAPLERLEQLRRERPDDPEVLTALGKRLQAAGDLPEAVKTLQKAVQLTAGGAPATVALADAEADAGDLRAARASLDALVKAHPDSGDAHFALGKLARRARNWTQAYEHAQNATRLDARNALAWHLLGQAAAQTGKLDEAAAAFTKAYEIDPKHWETQLGRGEVELQKERYAEAVPFFREAARLAPGEALPALSLGQTLLKAGKERSPEARQALTRAVNLRPEIPMAQFNLGKCLVRDGELDAGLDRMELAADLDPSLAEVQQELGRVYRQKGNEQQSARAFARGRLLLNLTQEDRVIMDKVVAAGPETPAGKDLQRQMARRLAAAGLYDSAAGLYRSLIGKRAEPALRAELAQMEARRDREDPPLARGDRLVRVRQFARAAACYRRAVQADPKNARAWEGAGVALASAGDTEAALPCLLRAVRLDPKRQIARTALGEACYGAAFPAAAARWLQPAADAGDPAALHLLGLALSALPGRGADAQAALEKAAKAEPNFRRDADAARAGTLAPLGAAIGGDDAKAQASLRDPAVHVALARAAQKAGLDLRAFVEFSLAQMLGLKDPAVDKERLDLGNQMGKAGELPPESLIDALAVASMPEDFQP